MWWNLKIVSPELPPNKNTKGETNKQKPNRITSAQAAADNDKMPELTTSRHIAKPNVCVQLSCLCDERSEQPSSSNRLHAAWP